MQVWEIQRAENVRRTAELIDGLRVQSTLFAIREGGDMFWKQMKIKWGPLQARERPSKGLIFLAAAAAAAGVSAALGSLCLFLPVSACCRSLSVSRNVREQMVALWASLDEEHLGQIDRPKLFRFLKSQGLMIRTEADVNVS